MKKKVKIIVAALLTAVLFTINPTEANAQWQVGAKAGINFTSIDRSQYGRVDESYSSCMSWTAGILARYSFNNWFSLKMEMNLIDRSHRMYRNLNYLEPVHTVHHNTYFTLPVLADFSFGGAKLRGHMYAGGYFGCLLNAKRQGVTFWMTDYNIYFDKFNETESVGSEYNRPVAGINIGTGLSYDFNMKWSILIDALYMYDITSYHKSTPHISDPRYLSSLGITLGTMYRF